MSITNKRQEKETEVAMPNYQVNESPDNPLYQYPVYYNDGLRPELLRYRSGFPSTTDQGCLEILVALNTAIDTKVAIPIHNVGDSEAVLLSRRFQPEGMFWHEPFYTAHARMAGLGSYTNHLPTLALQCSVLRKEFLDTQAPIGLQYDWTPMENLTVDMLEDNKIQYRSFWIESPEHPTHQCRVKRKIQCASFYHLWSRGLFSLLARRNVCIVGHQASEAVECLTAPGFYDANAEWVNYPAVWRSPQKYILPYSVSAVGFPDVNDEKQPNIVDVTLNRILRLKTQPDIVLLSCGALSIILGSHLARYGISSIDMGAGISMLCGLNHSIGGLMPSYRV